MSYTLTTHNALAWVTTDLRQRVDRVELHSRFFLIKESTNMCIKIMISPGKYGFNCEQFVDNHQR